MTKDFDGVFYVMRRDNSRFTGLPTKFHYSYETALKEADRLMKRFPEASSFVVMRALGVAKP